MQQLHVVGFTTDHRSLIFSTRRGSKTGTYVIAVDDELLAAVDEARDRLASGDGSAADEASARYPVPEPPRSALTVREVQSRLRLGYTVDRVAREAGVDPSWVERFASPVVAELTEVIRAAQRSRVVRPRGGPSATSLGESVLRNLAERGVPMAESDMGRAWQARQLLDGSWLVTLTYANRDREFEVSWEFDNSSGALRPRDRVASELGFVADPEWSDAPVESEAAHDESPQAPVPEERSESQRRVAEMRRAAQDRMVADAERASRRAAAMVRRTTPRPADVPPAPRAATAEAVAGLVAGEPIDPAPSDRDRPQAEGPRPAFEPRVGNGLDDDDDEDVASGAGSAPDDAQPTDGEDEEEQEWKAPVVDDGGTTGVAGRPSDGGDGPTDVAGALVPAPWSVGAEPETTPGPSEGHPADAAETLAPGHDAVEDLDEADGPTARETVDEGPPAASGSAGRLFAPEPAADEFERTMPFERIATDGPAPVQVSAIALGDNDGDEDEAGPAGAGGSIEDVGLDEREPVEPVEEVGRRDDPPAASPPEQSPPATPPLVPAAAPALPPVAPGPAGAKMPGPPWPRRRVPLQAVRLRPAAPAAAPAAVPPQLDGPGDDEPAPTPPAPDDRQGEPSGAPRGDAGQVPASAVGGSDDLDEDADPGPAVVPVWDEQDDGWGDDDEDEPVASGWADGPDRGWDDDDDDDWGAGRGGGSGEVGTVEPQAGAPEAGRPRRLPLRLRATEGRGSKPAGEAMVAGDRRGPRFRPDLARPADPTASADDGGATPARRRQLRAEPPGAGPAPPARRSEPLRARPRPSDE
ncbi:MAG: septation protein SepH [Acidimicrobiia bacterium]